MSYRLQKWNTRNYLTRYCHYVTNKWRSITLKKLFCKAFFLGWLLTKYIYGRNQRMCEFGNYWLQDHMTSSISKSPGTSQCPIEKDVFPSVLWYFDALMEMFTLWLTIFWGGIRLNFRTKKVFWRSCWNWLCPNF